MLARVFPLSERSDVNVLGDFHVDRTILFESIGRGNLDKTIGTITTSIDDVNGSSSGFHGSIGDYDLYQTFCSLQPRAVLKSIFTL